MSMSSSSSTLSRATTAEVELNEQVADTLGVDRRACPRIYAVAALGAAAMPIPERLGDVRLRDGTTMTLDRAELLFPSFPGGDEMANLWDRNPAWGSYFDANWCWRVGECLRLRGEIDEAQIVAVKMPPRRYLFDPAGREEILAWAFSGGKRRLRAFALTVAKAMDLDGIMEVARRIEVAKADDLPGLFFEVGLRAKPKHLISGVLAIDHAIAAGDDAENDLLFEAARAAIRTIRQRG